MPEYTDPHFTDNIFRGYDIRGKYPDELNEAGAYTIGRAYSTFLSRRRINECVISGDNRITTPNIKRAIIDGLLDSGINVIDLGLGLVYFMYFGQYYFQSKGGVNVSASHNPKEYNGFKLAVGFSDTMITEEIVELREIAKKGKFTTPNEKGEYREEEIFSHYKNDLFKKMPDKLSFRVVVDGGNCTPGKFMPDILREAGCEVIEQNTELDGNFPLGAPDPIERKMAERLSQKVLESSSDIGFSYDSDGDRIGVVDEKGGILWNDILVALFASAVLDKKPKAKIVFNALCSKVVTDVIRQKGGKPIMWRTGHSFIKAKAQKEKALFAGELSGHFYFLDKFYPHDDGAYSTLALLDYLRQTKKSLSQLVADFPKYISSPEIKIHCADDKKIQLIGKIAPILRKDFPEAEVIDDERAGDGVRLDLANAMFVVRYSQNGPYLTVRLEAKEQELYDRLKNYLRELLKKYPEVIWGNSDGNLEALD